MITQLKTGTRVLLLFASPLLVMLCITLTALWRLHAANESTHYLVDDTLAKQQLAAELLGNVKLNGSTALSIAKSDSLETQEYFQAQLANCTRSLSARMAKLVRMPQNAEEAERCSEDRL